MDLHDFDDVAENYDLYLDEMYKDEDDHAGFREFYLDFAKQYGGGGIIDKTVAGLIQKKDLKSA